MLVVRSAQSSSYGLHVDVLKLEEAGLEHEPGEVSDPSALVREHVFERLHADHLSLDRGSLHIGRFHLSTPLEELVLRASFPADDVEELFNVDGRGAVVCHEERVEEVVDR